MIRHHALLIKHASTHDLFITVEVGMIHVSAVWHDCLLLENGVTFTDLLCTTRDLLLLERPRATVLSCRPLHSTSLILLLYLQLRNTEIRRRTNQYVQCCLPIFELA